MNAEVSLATWGVAVVISSYILLCQNKVTVATRWISFLILAFTLIQLLEGMLWLTKDSKVRDYLTRGILIALMLQPLVNTWLAGQVSTPMRYVSYGYLVLFIFMIQYALCDSRIWNSVVGENGHLVWKKGKELIFNNITIVGILYLLGIIVPMMFIPGRIKWLVIAITTGTGIWSYLKYDQTGEFSSMWCFTAALLVPLALIGNRS